MAAYATGTSWGFPDDVLRKSSVEEEENDWTDVEADETAEPVSEPRVKPEPHAESQDRVPPAAEDVDKEDTEQRQHHQQEQRPKPERYWRPRTCRICLETVLPTLQPVSESLPSVLAGRPKVTYESEEGGRLLRPCKCKGSQKYVHEDCLSAWRRQNPLQKRNYWQCPTCLYSYKLQRLTWGRWLGSTAAQIALTIAIMILTMFALGFVADPIINIYLDPLETIQTGGGPSGSMVYEGEKPSWTEHFIKGLASLGLLGFAKFVLTISPWSWWNMRNSGLLGGGGVGRSGIGGTGRERAREIRWIAVLVGIATFLYAVWKGVRAWSRRTLESVGEKVMDVPGEDDDDHGDDD